jgi:hypothetical protein
VLSLFTGKHSLKRFVSQFDIVQVYLFKRITQFLETGSSDIMPRDKIAPLAGQVVNYLTAQKTNTSTLTPETIQIIQTLADETPLFANQFMIEIPWIRELVVDTLKIKLAVLKGPNGSNYAETEEGKMALQLLEQYGSNNTKYPSPWQYNLTLTKIMTDLQKLYSANVLGDPQRLSLIHPSWSLPGWFYPL